MSRVKKCREDYTDNVHTFNITFSMVKAAEKGPEIPVFSEPFTDQMTPPLPLGYTVSSVKLGHACDSVVILKRAAVQLNCEKAISL